MAEDVFKAPKAKKTHNRTDSQGWSPRPKRRRTKEDFFSFCNIVLAYTQYDSLRQEELRAKNNTSPLDSGGSTAESFTSESTTSSLTSMPETDHDHDEDSNDDELLKDDRLRVGNDSGKNDDSWDLVTCYCLKPFAGRPMIECSECLTWIHLSCAKIRKNNIPEEFICQKCREAKFTTRKSSRIRSEKRPLNA